MPRGKYIVIEGLEGSGKTTQFTRLVSRLGTETLAVREPGGTELGEAIRELLKTESLPRSPRANMFLFMTVRANLVDLVIRPAVEAGKTVVSDRNWLSTFAYQGAEGIDTEQIVALTRQATQEFFEADLSIVIDVEPEVVVERMRKRHEDVADRFDYFGADALETFRLIRQRYLDAAKRFERVVVVDGNRTPDEVWQTIEDACAQYDILSSPQST